MATPRRPLALIVEDEPDTAAAIADLVDTFGHDHRQAETRDDALALLDQGGFSYVLLDLQIKAHRESLKAYAVAGLSLLHEIRRRHPERTANDMHRLPVLVVSGHAKEHDDVVQAFQGGADDFIRKPLSAGGQDICARIRDCLERAAEHPAPRWVVEHPPAGETQGPSDVGIGGIGDTVSFWHSPDYAEVGLHGQTYVFRGAIQRAVIRILHQAAVQGQAWQPGRAVLTAAGSRNASMSMRNVLGKHPAWGTLVVSNGRGGYRLQTS